MAIRSSDPTHRALHRTLCELVTECGGTAAAVLDEGNGLWCASDGFFAPLADRFYREEIAARPEIHLKRGSGLHVVRQSPEHAYVAESFASIYVLVLWFEGDFDPFTARTRVRAVLPRIEALTLGLPPPFGSDGSGGKSRA